MYYEIHVYGSLVSSILHTWYLRKKTRRDFNLKLNVKTIISYAAAMLSHTITFQIVKYWCFTIRKSIIPEQKRLQKPTHNNSGLKNSSMQFL